MNLFMLLLLNALVTNTHNDPVDRRIIFSVDVAAPLDSVWNAWTTERGIRSFFAPQCNLDFRVGGAYEMFFDPSAAAGKKGGEGNKLLAIQNKKMISFTWNAPPSLPDIRDQRTHVAIRFEAIDAGKTKVTLIHGGWGEGGQWDEAFNYFTRAWGEVVLPRLQKRFEQGPLDL